MIDQLRSYLDFAAAASGEESYAVPTRSEPRQRWYRRGPVLAAFAAVVVLAVGIPALMLGSSRGTPPAAQFLEPLDVGVERVWPDSGFTGTPDETARAFAREALGWPDVETVSNPDASPDGPVWTTIRHSGSQDLDVLSIPLGEGRRALTQVGFGMVTVETDTSNGGQLVGIPQVSEADTAILHIRFMEPDRVEVLQVDHSDLERGQAQIGTGSAIGGVVVVYLDADGVPVTAAGGHFGPFGDSTPPDLSSPDSTSTSITNGTTVPPAAADMAVVNGFVQFAKSPSDETFPDLLLADTVALGLGPETVRTVDKGALRGAQEWVIDVADFRGYVGPFSALDVLSSLEDYDIQIGEHLHCAGPPQPPPNELQDLRRVSVQPSEQSIGSCLEWSTVDFFVDEDRLVQAITMDLWEP
ncbi:MAG: hypothetical protein PVG83_09670 [Acidimicrobiia bacterium]